ncbi:HAMP domain-containing histidine kinase [Reichenbachiella agarivorans]|uniref:histidine kinase n=1 Tax=Reichenbachiella agarivorans TaxID=2979464 RepID=A0ABY6CK48_9BACT|nr:HAMP domain-containing sensor histidine kinase [Reichenbachiella agarivorans]UXP30902.1 HAMP domain-containing histidine kinase [Reichenbachiella agarivorans]
MIRLRVALLFSFLTGLALLFFMSLVYFTSKDSMEDNFFDDLMDKAKLEGEILLEKDELAAEIYQEIISNHLVRLNQEQLYVIPLYDVTRSIADGILDQYTLDLTLSTGERRFYKDQEQWVSLFYSDNEGDFIILLTAIDDESEGELNDLISSMFSGLVVTMIVQFFVGWFFAKEITFPIINIATQLKEINTSKLSSRVVVSKKKDEVQQLELTLNEMLDRLEKGFDLQKKFLANASHELKTPLTIISGESDVALHRTRTEAEYQHSLRVILTEADKLTHIIADLIQLTEVSMGGSKYFEKTEFGIEDLVLDLQATMFRYFGEDLLRVQYIHEETSYALLGNKNWLLIAFINITKNALKFSDKQPVTVRIEYKTQEQSVVVEFVDQGIGIPADDLPLIVNPFFRASNVGNISGSGVGLSIVQEIIKLHQGEMQITSQVDQGTTVRLILPIVS